MTFCVTKLFKISVISLCFISGMIDASAMESGRKAQRKIEQEDQIKKQAKEQIQQQVQDCSPGTSMEECDRIMEQKRIMEQQQQKMEEKMQDKLEDRQREQNMTPDNIIKHGAGGERRWEK